MKKAIKIAIIPVLILLLGVSIIGNWTLLTRNSHLNKKVENLTEELAKYDEDYRLYAGLYDECEFNLNSTMETLEKTTKELETLKKK